MMIEAGRISDPDQVQALESPVRQDILDTLLAGGRMAVRALGEQIGQEPSSLYYHLRELERVGLVERVDRRRTDGRVEALYFVHEQRLEIEYRPDDPENRHAVKRVVRSILRLAGRDFEKGFDHEGVVVAGSTRNLWGGRKKAWLDDDEIRQANKLIRELSALFSPRRDRQGRTLCTITWVLTPVLDHSGGGGEPARP